MTLTELCEQLKKITYGESPEEMSELAAIVNMSLQRLYSDISVTSVYSFYKNEILPISRPLSFHKKGGVDLTLPTSGRAYGMHVSGKGVFRIVTDIDEREVEFDTFGEFFSGVVNGKGEIQFLGDCSYDVYSLSFYDEIGADDLSDIPTGYPRKYDLTDMIPYFKAPVSMPKDAAGCEIDGAEYIGGCLYLPPDYTGLVSIEYSRYAEEVSDVLCDKDITIDARYTHLLLHLAAYYSLLESEADLADRHLKAYLDMLPSPIPTAGYKSFGKYVIEDGWA